MADPKSNTDSASVASTIYDEKTTVLSKSEQIGYEILEPKEHKSFPSDRFLSWEAHVASFPEHLKKSLRLYSPFSVYSLLGSPNYVHPGWQQAGRYILIKNLIHPESKVYHSIRVYYQAPCSYCCRDEPRRLNTGRVLPCFDIWSALKDNYMLKGVVALVKPCTREVYPKKYWTRGNLSIEGVRSFRAVYRKESRPGRVKRFFRQKACDLDTPIYVEDIDPRRYVVYGQL